MYTNEIGNINSCPFGELHTGTTNVISLGLSNCKSVFDSIRFIEYKDNKKNWDYKILFVKL
jgi:hypothetical protein